MSQPVKSEKVVLSYLSPRSQALIDEAYRGIEERIQAEKKALAAEKTRQENLQKTFSKLRLDIERLRSLIRDDIEKAERESQERNVKK